MKRKYTGLTKKQDFFVQFLYSLSSKIGTFGDYFSEKASSIIEDKCSCEQCFKRKSGAWK